MRHTAKFNILHRLEKKIENKNKKHTPENVAIILKQIWEALWAVGKFHIKCIWNL